MASQFATDAAADMDWLAALLEQGPSTCLDELEGTASASVTQPYPQSLPCQPAPGVGPAAMDAMLAAQSLPDVAEDVDLTFLDSLLNGDIGELPPIDFACPEVLDCNGTMQQQPAGSHGSNTHTGQYACSTQAPVTPGATASGSPSGCSSPAYPAPCDARPAAGSGTCSPAASAAHRASTPPFARNDTAASSQAAGGSGGPKGSAGSVQPAGGDKGATSEDSSGGDEEQKRQVRMQRNRESAQLSRQRKKMQLDEMERRNGDLVAQNKYLTGLVHQLTAENASLRHNLVHVCQTTNTPLPAAATTGAVPGGMPAAYPGPPGGGLPPPGYPGFGAWPMFGYTPKLPIQKLAEPARPAPAAKGAAPGGAGKGGGSSGGKRGAGATGQAGGAKKAKAAAGTALLALCALFMFVGTPSWPAPQGGGGVDSYAAAVPAPLAPGRVLASGAPAPGPGSRALLPAAAAPSSASSAAAGGGPVAPDPWQQHNASQHGSSPFNASAGEGDGRWDHALALLPSNAGAESAALQRLIDAGNVALVWDPAWAASNPGVEHLLPDWANFPSLLGSTFRAEGLLAPIGCDKVFEVDARHVAEHSKLKRKMESYLSALQGFKGRAVPLPPTATEASSAGEEEHPRIGQHESAGGAGLPGSGKGDVLVSVVLPLKQDVASAAGPGVMAMLDRIFVVVLQQSAVYATYSCQLPRLGGLL